MSRLFATFTLLALLAVPATASAQAPTPGCQGVHVTDKSGDSANSLQSSQTGSPSSDLIAGFLTYDEASHTAKANIQVVELTEGEVDPPYTAISWEFKMSTPAGPRYVRAYADRTGIVKYTWGEPRAITDDQTAPRVGGNTTGAMFPGPNGIVSIDMPLKDMGVNAGQQLKGLGLEVRQWGSLPSAVPSTPLPLYSPAPIYDDAAGKGAFNLTACPAPGAEPAPVTTTPEPTTNAAPTASPATLAVKVTVPKLRAKRVNRARKIRVKLSGKATRIVAQLRKGGVDGKIVAAGKRAKLAGKGRLTLKVRGKLRKGRYALVFSGRNADGQPAEGAVGVRIR